MKKNPLNHFELSDNFNEKYSGFRSKPDRTSHLELPNSKNVSFSKGYARLFFWLFFYSDT